MSQARIEQDLARRELDVLKKAVGSNAVAAELVKIDTNDECNRVSHTIQQTSTNDRMPSINPKLKPNGEDSLHQLESSCIKTKKKSISQSVDPAFAEAAIAAALAPNYVK